MGKTALLNRALDQHRDFRVLRADCALGSAGDQLAAGAGWALRVEPSARSPGRLLAAVRALVTEGGPVAIALDNVQRIDADSAAEFSALLRAVRGAALLVLCALRVPWQPATGEPSIGRLRQRLSAGRNVCRMTLAELSVAETCDLLSQAGALAPDEAAARLHQYTGGHPALLSSLLGQGSAAVHTQPADLLGLFDPLVMSVLRVVSGLPEPSQRLLAAMAVAREPWPLAVVGSVAKIADPFEALEPLLDAGLAEWFPAEPVTPVAIRYPLYRDVIYRSLPAARRTALHGRAAGYATGTRAWAHRAAADLSAAPTLAAVLAQEAERYYAAGDNEQAGMLLIWSASTAADSRERDRYLARAASWGLRLRAVDWDSHLEACLGRYRPSASRAFLLGLLAEAAGRFSHARTMLSEAGELARAERDQGGDDARAISAGIELIMAMVQASLGQPAEEGRLADRILAIPGLPAVHRSTAEYLAADARGRTRGPGLALRVLAKNVPDSEIDAHGSGQPAGSESIRLWARGVLRLLGGQLRAGSDDLARMLRAADRAAASPFEPAAHAYLGYAQYLLGDMKGSEQAVAQAVMALAGHGIARSRVFVHAVAACVDAVAGRAAAAANHLQTARRWQAESGPADFAAFPALAIATIAQVSEDYQRMTAALGWLPRGQGQGVLHEAWWRPLQVEALVGAGQLSAARRALGRLISRTDVLARQPTTIAWLECRLDAAAHGEDAKARFSAALAAPAAPDDIPLHRARMAHDYGRFLMSARNRRAAIGWLRRAAELYRELGAQPFYARCAADLERCGVRLSGSSGLDALASLAPRERAIADLAAAGLTNAEIAGSLFISVKTVEYHLASVFAKFGISSRRQLAARLGGESPA
jgi:DNA-binding CsgD family transcriptional regulator